MRVVWNGVNLLCFFVEYDKGWYLVDVIMIKIKICLNKFFVIYNKFI